MSFFGYDTSQPRNPKHKKAQDYDEILEAKYKYAQDVSGELEDDDPELNDVTFDTDPTQMSQDFDFGNQTSSQLRSQQQMPAFFNQKPPMNMAQNTVAPSTLEEIEAQMFRAHIAPRPMMGGGGEMSLEQVEAQLRAGQYQQPQQWNRPTGFPQPQFRQGMQYQRPVQPIHPVQPAPPSPLVINGIRYSPVQIASTEKMAVFDIFQKIKPLFVHIDTLIQTLYEARGELELARLQTLKQLKGIIAAQFELFPQGIFILRPQDAQQVHKSLVQIFQYAEGLLLHKQQSQQVQQQVQQAQQRAPSPVREPEPEVEQESMSEEEQAEEPVEEEDVEPVLNQADFPVLGAQSKAKDYPALGTESQPKESNRNQQPNRKDAGDKKKKQWTKLGGNDTGIVIGDDPDMPRIERYKGLMRKHEKELIAKIQISQLVTDEPMVDDYYFQMHKLRQENKEEAPVPEKEKKGKKSKKWLQSTEQFVGKSSGAAISNQMQQQMKRLIESRKATKPRESSVSLEGALGMIGKKTAKTPKQAITISATRTAPANATSHIASLKAAEKIYSAILKYEGLERKKTDNLEEEELEQHENDLAEAKNELWRQLVPTDDVPVTIPHPLVSAMNHVKGLKAARRALNILGVQPALGFFSLLFKRFECLEVANIPLGQEREKVEMFMNYLFPKLTDILNDSTLPVLNALMQVILERHNLQWLAKGRVGLVILTMILSRAELLKQANQSPTAGPPSEEDLGMWSEVYDFIFSSFQNHFATLFGHNVEPSDEVFIWQFLSAMAVGASDIENQRILVTELRENVISTAKTNHPKAMENVNLFLTALGLNIDAAQLAAMSS